MSRWSCRCPFLLLIVASFILVNQPQPTDAAAIPIWELLKHEEKVTIDFNFIPFHAFKSLVTKSTP
jgi:hypothetical protein